MRCLRRSDTLLISLCVFAVWAMSNSPLKTFVGVAGGDRREPAARVIPGGYAPKTPLRSRPPKVVDLFRRTANIGLAGDEVLFRYAVALQNETGNAKFPDLERLRCFGALARLGRERETMQILKAWSSVGDIDQEDKMRMCWEHELYWAGFNLARSSKLPLSIKLASLAGCNRVPPESLVTELLDRESGAVTQSDQDAAALLQFAALYDNACRNGGSKADLTKLVSAAIAIAPRALRLLDGSYPPGRNYSHFQPVEHEVDQCYLAILSIVPAKDRTNAIIKMMKSLGAGGIWAMSNCAARGWVPAVETECDLHSDDDWAVLRWRTALLAIGSSPESVGRSRAE